MDLKLAFVEKCSELMRVNPTLPGMRTTILSTAIHKTSLCVQCRVLNNSIRFHFFLVSFQFIALEIQ